MQIILIDDVLNLGKRGQVVQVANGYGRNYLIPKRLAIPATPGNLKMIEQQRVALAKKEIQYKEEAEILARELDQLHILLGRKAGDTGVLFGSVTAKDVVELLEQDGIQLDRRKIILPQPIKRIGSYKLKVHLHDEVEAELLLSVPVETDQSLTRVKKKDEESDQIVAELDAKIKEMEQLIAAQTAQEAEGEEPQNEKSPPHGDQ